MATKLAGITATSLVTPGPSTFVVASFRTLGIESRSSPHWFHRIQVQQIFKLIQVERDINIFYYLIKAVLCRVVVLLHARNSCIDYYEAFPKSSQAVAKWFIEYCTKRVLKYKINKDLDMVLMYSLFDRSIQKFKTKVQQKNIRCFYTTYINLNFTL